MKSDGWLGCGATAVIMSRCPCIQHSTSLPAAGLRASPKHCRDRMLPCRLLQNRKCTHGNANSRGGHQRWSCACTPSSPAHTCKSFHVSHVSKEPSACASTFEHTPGRWMSAAGCQSWRRRPGGTAAPHSSPCPAASRLLCSPQMVSQATTKVCSSGLSQLSDRGIFQQMRSSASREVCGCCKAACAQVQAWATVSLAVGLWRCSPYKADRHRCDKLIA